MVMLPLGFEVTVVERLVLLNAIQWFRTDFGIFKTNSIANYHHKVLGFGNVSILIGAPISAVTKGMPSAAASL